MFFFVVSINCRKIMNHFLANYTSQIKVNVVHTLVGQKSLRNSCWTIWHENPPMRPLLMHFQFKNKNTRLFVTLWSLQVNINTLMPSSGRCSHYIMSKATYNRHIHIWWENEQDVNKDSKCIPLQQTAESVFSATVLRDFFVLRNEI